MKKSTLERKKYRVRNKIKKVSISRHKNVSFTTIMNQEDIDAPDRVRSSQNIVLNDMSAQILDQQFYQHL